AAGLTSGIDLALHLVATRFARRWPRERPITSNIAAMGGRKRTEPDGGGAAKRASGPGLRRIGFVGFKDALALDIVGPMEVFSLASAIEPGRTPRYRCVLIGLNRRPFVAES